MKPAVRRALLVASGLALPLAAACVAVRSADEDRDRWLRVTRRDLVIGAEVEGELRAVDSTELGPPQISELWDFRISSLATDGSEVKAGEPVLGFDTTLLAQQLAEKLGERDAAEKELEKSVVDHELELQAAQLEIAEARGRLRRAELKLSVPSELVASIDLDKARIEHRLATQEVESLTTNLGHLERAAAAELAAKRRVRDRAAGRVAELESAIARMTVVAPRDGTVIAKPNWQGEKKKIGDSAWKGEIVLEIPDLRRMRAEGQVAESDSGRLEAGQRVRLRLDAHPDLEYGATVRSIRRSVQAKSRSNPRKVVRVDLELDRTDTERMRPGMRFRGTVVSEVLEAALTVPKEAVTAGPGGATVWVRTLFGRRRVEPELGRRDDDGFQVLSGLKEGERVLASGASEQR